jgi:hypothetical protein
MDKLPACTIFIFIGRRRRDGLIRHREGAATVDKLVEDARKSVEDAVQMALISLCFGWIALSDRVSRDAARLASDAEESARKFGELIGR